MDNQDILKTLNNLEQNLQNVESARQQVENTVNAYEGAKSQLHALTIEFTHISTELKNVYSAINENVGTIDDTLRNKVDTLFNDFKAKAKAFEGVGDKIQSSFDESCQKTVQMFADSLDENMQKIGSEMDKCIADFNQKANHEIEGITTTLSNFKLAVEEMQKGFDQSLSYAAESIKTKQEKIAEDFIASIKQHVSAFSNLKDELDSIVKQYNKISKTLADKIENLAGLVAQETDNLHEVRNAQQREYEDLASKLNSLREGNVKAANNLSDRLKSVDSQLGGISQSLDEIKDRVDKVTYATSSLRESQKKTESKLLRRIDLLQNEVLASKKFTLVSLVLLVISILINVIVIMK